MANKYTNICFSAAVTEDVEFVEIVLILWVCDSKSKKKKTLIFH